MKKVSSLILAMFIGFLFTPCITPVTKANAGQSDFIAPLFSGYVEDKSKATIIKHNTVIDMSNYNGAGGIDFDAGKIMAISNYTISNAQAGATFCIPYMGTMDELNEVEILINGQLIQAERLYGEYRDFEDRMEIVSESESALDMVKKAVANKIGKFTKMDIVAMCPSLSNSSVESSLKKLAKEGFIEKKGASRATYYIKIEKPD